MKFDSRLLHIYVTAAAAIILALILAQMYWKRRLTKWAESQHLQLVSASAAPGSSKAPSAWTRSRNQHVFRVVTKDRNGLTRYSWIRFGTFWGFTWGEPITKVKWSDADD